MSRCSSSVLTVNGPRRVGAARQHVRLAADADDVRGVPAAGALRVVGVDRAAGDRREAVVDVARLVQRVGVDRDLDVLCVGDAEAAVDRRGRRAPVLVQLEADGAGAHLVVEPLGARAVALAEQPDVHGQRVGRLQHPGEVEDAGRAGRGVGAARRARAAADDRRDAGGESLGDLLGRDEVDVRVDAAGRDDQALRRDRVGRHADDHAGRDPGHRVGVARLADAGDAAVLDADVGLADAGPVEDQRVRDHAVERVGIAAADRLALRVAQHLAAAELALVAVGRRVRLDLDHERGVAEAHAIAGRRPEHRRVLAAWKQAAHATAAPSRRAAPSAPRRARSARRCRPGRRAACASPPRGRTRARR